MMLVIRQMTETIDFHRRKKLDVNGLLTFFKISFFVCVFSRLKYFK